MSYWDDDGLERWEYQYREPFPTPPVAEELLAQTIGEVVLHAINLDDMRTYAQALVEKEAVAVLQEIKAVLDSPDLDDKDCFQRIEEILSVWSLHGLTTGRHEIAL